MPPIMANINWYYIFTILVIACGSIPKGYDEGGFSSSTGLTSFKNDYGLNANQWPGDPSGLADRKANISSFGVLGAAIGSLLILAVCDRLGRLRCWQLSMLIWMTGNLMQTFASGILGLMLFARVWGGLGAGGLTVVAPLYLSEIAPAKSRGMVVSIYMVVLLTFLTIGFFISYGAQRGLPSASREQYRLVIAISLVPTGLALLASFFISDTPRWLASQGRTEEAIAVLARLRSNGSSSSSSDHKILHHNHHHHPNEEKQAAIAAELADLHRDIHTKSEALAGTTFLSIIKEIMSIRTYRTRFLLGFTMQLIAQWTGGNGITYYVPEIFTYAGVTGDNTSLITSGAYGIVKLVFTMAFTWGLVDVFGRRVCFTAGLALQCVTHVYMAVYMGIWKDSGNKGASDAAIASVFVYAVGWSIGLCTVQYLYSTEIYPTRIRNVCYAFNMACHWFFQFAVVRVTPNMFASLDIWGAYLFWALECFIGLVILWLWAPETKGVPMERMEELFAGHWYMGWKARGKMDLSLPAGGSESGTVVGDEDAERSAESDQVSPIRKN